MKIKDYLLVKFKKYQGLSQIRRLSVVFFIIGFILSQVVVISSILAINDLTGMSTDIKFPHGLSFFSLDENHPEELEVRIPYRIHNKGLFFLSTIVLEAVISVKFTSSATTRNKTIQVCEMSKNIYKCAPNELIFDYLTAKQDSFNITALSSFNQDIADDELVWIYANLSFEAKYFLELIDIKIYQRDVIF